jgi:hypothetical protein
VSKNKQLDKKIAGQERQIELHQQKIEAEFAKPEPNYRLIHKWELDITVFQAKLHNLLRRRYRDWEG